MVMGSLPVERDVVIIGGGPGGYAAAFRAADLGLDVTVINDEEDAGGVCLHRGCIPSKALLHLVELLFMTREAKEAGLEFQEPKIDLDKLRQWKDEVVDSLTQGLESLFEQRGIEQFQARARFAGNSELHLEATGSEDEEVPTGLKYKHAIVATGSRPQTLPGVEFDPDGRIMDSAIALGLPEIPESLLVVGGGYVGLELGMVYAALGSQVTLTEMEDRLLPAADSDLVEPLADRLDDVFEDIHLNTKVVEIEESKNGVKVKLEKDGENSKSSFQRALVAIGRRPNTGNLDLHKINVRPDENGFLAVDRQQRTENDSVFAIGDAAGGMMLAHEAVHQGRVAAEAIAGQASAFDARAIPAIVYTDPQVAWCGLTERQAQEGNQDIRVARFPWKASGRAQSMSAPEGLTKLILDPQTERILGVGIVGRQAESLIGEAGLAVEMGAVAEDLALTVHPHPTLSETLGEAAEIYLGSPTHAPKKKEQ